MSSPSFIFRAADPVAPTRKRRIAVFGIVAIVLLVIQSGFGQAVLKDAGISRQVEPFVELYFPSPQALPSLLPASDRLKLTFAVRYVGSANHAMAWRVSEKANKTQIGLASGHFVVAMNQTDVIVRRVRVHCLTKRVQLLVSIARSSTRITLWLVCPNPR
jgi:hypothetical protein